MFKPPARHGKPRPANGTAMPTPLTERRGESPSRRPHGDGRSAQTGDLPGGNGVVSTPVREESAPDVGFRPRIPSIPRRERCGGPEVRLHSIRVPGDDPPGHRAEGGRPAPPGGPGEPQAHGPDDRNLAEPQEGRDRLRRGGPVYRGHDPHAARPARPPERRAGAAAGRPASGP